MQRTTDTTLVLLEENTNTSDFLRAPEEEPIFVPHYFVMTNVQALTAVLRTRGTYFLEVGQRLALEHDLRILQKDIPDFALCLTSQHTYDNRVAPVITQAINDRFPKTRMKRMHIVTCLQEALANAVVHGNLRIDCQRNSLESFERYYRLIDEGVRQPDVKDKRVYVRAWDYPDALRLCITHEGEGMLDPKSIAESHPQLEKKNGRGLFIIQSLAEQVKTDAERKSIDITFTY